jgi:hypothetical protein
MKVFTQIVERGLTLEQVSYTMESCQLFALPRRCWGELKRKSVSADGPGIEPRSWATRSSRAAICPPVNYYKPMFPVVEDTFQRRAFVWKVTSFRGRKSGLRLDQLPSGICYPVQ